MFFVPFQGIGALSLGELPGCQLFVPSHGARQGLQFRGAWLQGAAMLQWAVSADRALVSVHKTALSLTQRTALQV